MTDKETYNYNEIIQFSCSEGFFLQANQERNCTKNGPLKPPYPNCKGTDISWLMFTQGLLFVILHLCTTWILALIGNGKTINISIQLVFLNLNVFLVVPILFPGNKSNNSFKQLNANWFSPRVPVNNCKRIRWNDYWR